MPSPGDIPGHGQRFTEEWLINAIGVISEVIIEHGEKYAPWLDRLERELAELKRYDDPVSRARRHLARAQAAAPHIPASPAEARSR
jgi:hypothetical protein